MTGSTDATETDAPGRPRIRLVSRIRALANVLTLIGGILIAIGWAMHWPPFILGRVALATFTTFITSFIAILIENRTERRNGQGS